MDIDEQSAEIRSGRGARSGGASVEIHDRRFSKLIDWAQPIVSSLVVAGLLYFANKVGDLSDSIAQTNIQMALTRQQNTAMVDELKDHEVRIRQIEGRTFRGVDGFGYTEAPKRGQH